ncbi:MoaD/ThiS family protein [Actinomadura kijaniata]
MTGPAGRMTVTVRLPGALRDIAGARPAVPLEVPADATVGDLLDALAAVLPAVERRVRDERGVLRPHVNVFVGAANIRDLALLATPLVPDAEVYILPSVSGG